MSQNDCIGKTLKPWPILVDHYNLPYKANESHVKELFAEYGEVFAVRLMKDKRTGKRRGFGFVVIAAGQAQTAIDALNEKEYMQRTLKVRIANDPKSDEEMAEQD
ncbi:RNA-binding protein [Vibrio cholerae]|nr:RNA-binding protein [Vibrio cholerae]